VPYLTKIAVNIPEPSQISSDFAFENAPSDGAYRRVVFVDATSPSRSTRQRRRRRATTAGLVR
jgi:hypothetical protein